MHPHNASLEALHDIRKMMQRSSRFISLSGMSGVVAGVWALIGAYLAFGWIDKYDQGYNSSGYTASGFQDLKWRLILLGVAVLCLALISAFYFTWRKAREKQLPVWDHTSKRLLLHLFIPLLTGGLFVLAMLQYDEWRFVAPACLIFYGLALVNGSKFTLGEVYYLGLCEIILGLICTRFIGKGLYFWAVGFGVLHIIYGFIMWWKYDRKSVTD